MGSRHIPPAAALLTAIGVTVAWCGWVSGFHRSTLAAELTWVGSLVAVLAAILALRRVRSARWGPRDLHPPPRPWPRPGRGGPRRALEGLAPWLVLLAMASAWDLLGLATGPNAPHLTISALAQGYRPLNAALLLLWILVGVGYEAARTKEPLPPGPTTEHHPSAGPVPPPLAGVVATGGLGRFGPSPSAPGVLLPRTPSAGLAFWVAVPLCAVVIDVLARRSAGRVATAEEVVRFVSTSRVVNALLVMAWLGAGYHLFAR